MIVLPIVHRVIDRMLNHTRDCRFSVENKNEILLNYKSKQSIEQKNRMAGCDKGIFTQLRKNSV